MNFTPYLGLNISFINGVGFKKFMSFSSSNYIYFFPLDIFLFIYYVYIISFYTLYLSY